MARRAQWRLVHIGDLDRYRLCGVWSRVFRQSLAAVHAVRGVPITEYDCVGPWSRTVLAAMRIWPLAGLTVNTSEPAIKWVGDVPQMVTFPRQEAIVSVNVPPHVGLLIASLDREISRAELMDALGLSDRGHFAGIYVQAGAEAFLAEMTLPDGSRNRRQGYR